MRAPLAALAALALLALPAAGTAQGTPGAEAGAEDGPQAGGATASHGLSIHGDLKYPKDFKHLDYANPDAPKGGEVRLSAIGTFDTLNPFILKGVPADDLGITFATLLADVTDEPASAYGWIAESVETPPDRAWAVFTLRPEARFHDGTPITADDIVFSFEIVKSKGHPFYRAYYGSVAKAEKLDERRVRFTFAPGSNRELPFILGNGLPVLSRAFFETADFEKTTLEPILGSGPYRVEAVDPGRSITYRRVADYWGADLPVMAGRFNFDVRRIDYYRDSTVALEAFKAGEYDFRVENTAKVWATGYDFPALGRGLVKREEIPHQQPQGMQAFVFNTRRPFFADPEVRRALAYAFDFEWTNRNLFYGAYTRTDSYFSNSELASAGLPQGAELEILERFRGRIPDQVFTTPYRPPSTEVEGGIRTNLRTARRMLRDAGWVLADGRLVDGATGEPMRFEILLVNPAFERIVAPFKQNLERLGIEVRLRTVDTSQYEYRVENFDFDMIVGGWGESLSPGNEQRDFWSSVAAETPGSRNYAGIADPAVDELVELVISAPDRDSLVARTRALDRVLLWGHYVIPQWHISHFRVAYWGKFGRPPVTPRYGLGFEAWWVDPERSAALAARKGTAAERPESGDGAGTPWARAVLTAVAALALALWLARRIRRKHEG